MATQFRKQIYNLHRLDAYSHDALYQVDDVSRVAVLVAPVVRVVDDAAVFVGFDEIWILFRAINGRFRSG